MPLTPYQSASVQAVRVVNFDESETASGGATAAKQDAIIALLPASIGQKAKAGSFAVTLASDDDLLARLPAALATGGGMKSTLISSGGSIIYAANPSADGISATIGNVLGALSFGHIFDGTNWNRTRGDTVGGMWVQGNVSSLATDTGKPVKMGLVYNSTPPVATNGQRVDAQSDPAGNQKITQATLLAGEDQTFNRVMTMPKYTDVTTTADVLAKSGAGVLHTVSFSAVGTVTAGTVTLYDNTAESGTVLWSGIIPVGIGPISITLDVAFATGLYIGYDATIANVRTTTSIL